ncbi:MAG TPA: hypothetical protein PKZ65_09310 [Methanoregulaceae archaeon]|nr:hypothetical protein [Methanoregulaceae archaeon]
MKYGYLLVIVLAAIALLGLSGFAADPLLYAPEKEQAVSVFHANPSILPEADAYDSEDFAWLMQALIDGQIQIITSLGNNDVAAMKQNLSAYSANNAWLEGTAGYLGVTGGDVGIFLAGIKDQEGILREMVNKSETMNALTAARERGAGDAEAAATIASQTAAVREAEVVLLERYLADHAAVTKSCAAIGLDTRSYGTAQVKVREIIRTIKAETAPVEIPVPPADAAGRMTLLVEPTTAAYLDTVQVFGLVSPAEEGREVTIFLDNRPRMTAITDSGGNYLSRITVEQIRAGDHTLSARTGNRSAAGKVVTISSSGTTTAFTAEAGYFNRSETGAFCNGTVMAGLPVRNLPVLILEQGEIVATARTAENGTFRLFVPLSPGIHTLSARFSAEDYPLGPSESPPVTVTAPPTPIRVLDVLGIGALILVILGAGMYLFLRPRPESPAEGEPLPDIFPEAAPAPDTPEIPPEIGTLLARYEAMLREQGLSEAARRGYLDLAARIAAHLRLPAYRTLTPRELSAICSGKRYSGIFDIFVDTYEKIRYGGSTHGEDRAGFEQELQLADVETGKGKA